MGPGPSSPVHEACLSRADGRQGPGTAGFSLIEVVVSLAILALAGTIIVPGAVELVERFETQARFRMLVDQIENTRGVAVTRGEIVVLSSSESGAPTGVADIPPGWQLVFPAPLIFSPAAVCSGEGAVIVSAAGQRRYYSLDPATCRLEQG